MDPWTAGARTILERSPTGAAPLSRLLARLEGEGLEVEGRERWILKRLEEQPGLFRVLPDLGQPFRGWPSPPHRTPPTGGRVGAVGEPWILARPASPPAFGSRDQAVRRIQDTLGAWGCALDEESPRAVARWIRATLEAEGACSLLLREENPQL
jgi:hypothetical protein